MENTEKIEKLSPDESMKVIFEELENLSNRFDDEGKKIILNKLKHAEESYKLPLEMKDALKDLGKILIKSPKTIKDFAVKQGKSLKTKINEKLEVRREKKYHKRRERHIRDKEKYG